MRIKPGLDSTVETDTKELWRDGNGDLRYGINWALSEEEMEQVRTGYRCIACMHAPQPEPFPENCIESFCRYPMKTDQLRRFALEYRGSRRFGPTPYDEIDEMYGEQDERDHFKKRTGIWLPGSE